MRRRKLSYMLALVVAVGAVATGAALGANTVRCGGLYQPRCAPPIIPPTGLAPACKNPGSVITLPNLSLSAIAGIKSITIKANGRTILTKKNLNSVRKTTIKGVKINTASFKSGVHVVTIKLVDTRGVSTSRSLRFVICKPVPRTTG